MTAPDVLVVEDNDAVRLLLSVLVQKAGGNPVAVADGATALSLLRRHSYQAVVLDLLLPQVNGFEILRELHFRDPQLLRRVAVVTGALPSTFADCPYLPSVRFMVPKPFEIAEFSAVIEQLLATDATAQRKPPRRAEPRTIVEGLRKLS